MKYIKYVLIVLLIDCSGSVNSLVETVDDPKFEIKEWGTIGSYNRKSTNPDWDGKPGLQKAFLILNKGDVDLEFEFTLHIYGAVHIDNPSVTIPIEDAELLSSTLGLVSGAITPNYDPVDIKENSVIKSGDKGFLISFAFINWDNPYISVWSTVTIKATYVLSKKGYTVMETKYIEYVALREQKYDIIKVAIDTNNKINERIKNK